MKKRLDKSGLTDDLNKILKEEIIDHSIKEIYHQLNATDKKQRTKLLNDLISFINTNSLENETERIKVCKLLISLIPDSVSFLKEILNNFSSKKDYELQFTIFCYLDGLLDLNLKLDFITEIPLIIEKYLKVVPKDTANSSWMAGDLLGDHWTTEMSMPVLIVTSLTNNNKIGRDAALQGLGKLRNRVDKHKKEIINGIIRLISKLDTCSPIRVRAEMILQEKL